MNWCKIIGHKWEFYKEDVEVPLVIFNNMRSTISTQIDTEFRICKRCYHKQKRDNWTSKEKYDKYDWKDHQLSKEESREKLLKSLGI